MEERIFESMERESRVRERMEAVCDMKEEKELSMCKREVRLSVRDFVEVVGNCL